MSHLARIVDLKKELLSVGVTCPVAQQTTVENAYVQSLIRLHFLTGGKALAIDETIRNRYIRILDKLNSYTPVNGNLVLQNFNQFFIKLINEAIDYGRVTCADYTFPENFNAKESPAYNALLSQLYSEMSEIK